MSDHFTEGFSEPMDVQREAYVAPTGKVLVDVRKTINKAFRRPDHGLWYNGDRGVATHTGSLHLGLYGVTVTDPDGSAWMYPWRVVQAVQLNAPKAPG